MEFSEHSRQLQSATADYHNTSDKGEVCLASCLAFLASNSPDLARVVERWDVLPDAVSWYPRHAERSLSRCSRQSKQAGSGITDPASIAPHPVTALTRGRLLPRGSAPSPVRRFGLSVEDGS